MIKELAVLRQLLKTSARVMLVIGVLCAGPGWVLAQTDTPTAA